MFFHNKYFELLAHNSCFFCLVFRLSSSREQTPGTLSCVFVDWKLFKHRNLSILNQQTVNIAWVLIEMPNMTEIPLENSWEKHFRSKLNNIPWGNLVSFFFIAEMAYTVYPFHIHLLTKFWIIIIMSIYYCWIIKLFIKCHHELNCHDKTHGLLKDFVFRLLNKDPENM